MCQMIAENDREKIRNILKNVLGIESYIGLERMGGMTNHSYKVIVPNRSIYAVRLPGEGTEALINREAERVSTELACQLKIDAELLYFGEDGIKITRYIPEAETMSPETMREKRHIRQVAEILRKLHGSGENTGVPFEVFDMADGYEKVIRESNVPMFSDYEEMKAQVMILKTEIDAGGPVVRVPCHNDPLCENWIMNGDGRLYLIDWEYAGMNDGMWDVGCRGCFP